MHHAGRALGSMLWGEGAAGAGAGQHLSHRYSQRCMPCRSAAAAPAFLRQALGDAPRWATRGDICADLGTPGGVSLALNCMSLWHAGALVLRGAAVTGTGHCASQPVCGALAHLPGGGVFTARILRGADSDAAGGAHAWSDGGGDAAAGVAPDAVAAGGKGGGTPGVVDALLLPGEQFGDLLEQLQGQCRGWDRVGCASSAGERWCEVGAGGTAASGSRRGCCGWQSRPAVVATSELWQTQVVEAMGLAGVALTGAQLQQWRAAGLPGASC